MEWVETTGRTVEEAKRSALEQLGVEETDAEFEIVTEPRIGLFGRLKEEARVRARLRPRYPRSKGDRRDRRRPKSAGAVQGPTATEKASPRRTNGERSTVAEDGPDHQGDATSATAAAGNRRRRKTRANPTSSPEGASVADVGTITAEEGARAAEEFLKGLLDRLGTDASVSSTSETEGFVELNVSGDGLGILIGPKGATLLALQELTRTVVQRRFPSAETRVVVDVNGYRKRRHEALARFAQQVASEVVATNTRRALEPMPPADRKVVHDALNSVPGVMTVSEGEEPNRRVVLVPVQDGAGQNVPVPKGRVHEGTATGTPTGTQNDAGTLADEEPGAAEAAGQGVGSQQ